MAGPRRGASLGRVSDGIYEPVNDGDGDDGVIDLDQAFGEDGTDVVETSYSPPDAPRGLDAFGTTADEEQTGETLDQRIAQEEPDPAMAADLVDGGRAGSGEPDAATGSDATSAEEAAVHVVDGEPLAVDEGSSR